MQRSKKAIEVFYVYASEDEEFSQELAKQLRIFQEEGIITQWHNRQLLAETDYSQTIDPHPTTASLILFLISTDFLASGYCTGIEMKQVMERHSAGEAIVIPILVRHANWQWTPFAMLQILPGGGKPLKLHPDRDEAFVDLASDIHRVIGHTFFSQKG